MFTLFLSLIACSEKSIEEASGMPYCEEVETPLAIDEVSALGISMSEFTDALPEVYTVITVDSEECLSASVAIDADSVRYVQATVVTPESDGPVPSIHVECPDYLAVDASLSIANDDASISEQHAITLELSEQQLSEDGPMIASYRDDIDAPDSLSIEGLEDATFSINGEIGAETFSGAIDALTVEESGELALAMKEDVLRWSLSLEDECNAAE